jgi:glycine/D-amino acid oxidase-like deaminating enzyme
MMLRLHTSLILLCWLAQQVGGFQSLVRTRNRLTSTSASTRTASATISPRGSEVATGLDFSLSLARQQQSRLYSSAAANTPPQSRRSRGKQHKDVVVVGGGLAGLSVALYLTQLDPSRHITILEKEDYLATNKKTSVASFAAAGMLAPQSERLPKGDYLDLCLASKRMYPDFTDLVETLAKDAGEEGAPYLWSSTGESSGLEPWNIGYVASGGFLAPAFAGDVVATYAPPEGSGVAKWLDATQVRELEPNLHSNVVGGWWFPEDSSVDARRLTCSLRAACVGAGVQFLSGPNYEVTSLDLADGACQGLWLKNGKYFKAKSILVANGAWMRNLLPVPIESHKGQSLSLRMPKDQPPLLKRVLFAQDSYIVPKADGRIVIGATVEAGSFDPNVTPAGIMHILQHALQLVPGLADLPIEETWAGLRPTTPDKGPIIGETPWKNIFLAGGYWRNGVLLSPKTGELLASLIAGIPLSDEDTRLLEAFKWDRFTSKEGGAKMAADARYAASMYPIHKRKSGVGVAASVGTELGSYSTAVSAREERQKDRSSLFGDGGGDDAFERAAAMGQEDGKVFSFGGEKKWTPPGGEKEAAPEQVWETVDPPPSPPALLALQESNAVPYNGPDAVDAYTVGYASNEKDDEVAALNGADLESVYQSIKDNKAKLEVVMSEDQGEQRPDPGFRIHHIDEATAESREVPPYTQPGAFMESIQKEKEGSSTTHQDVNEGPLDGYQNLNGYQNPKKRNGAADDPNIAEAMRKARMFNRINNNSAGLDLDEDAFPDYSAEAAMPPKAPSAVSKPTSSSSDYLSSIYQKIRDQKAATTVEMGDATTDDRPDPGFRINHIDEETGESREVPPYTSPGAFMESIQKIKAKASPAPSQTMQSPSQLTATTPDEGQYSETTYDGYQDIVKANSAASRDAELEAMRKARQQNRLGQKGIDESELQPNHRLDHHQDINGADLHL